MTASDEQARPDKKTTSILEAAKTHFARHGFEATKLSDIARDAGVAVGTIYLRYPGKSELLAGTLEAMQTEFCTAMDDPEIWAQPFPERFQSIMRAVIDTAQAQQDLRPLMALASYAPKRGAKSDGGVLAAIERHLSDGEAKGQLRQNMDLSLVARLAHGMVEGALAELMTNPERSPDHVVEELALASWRWLGSFT
ncbi:TetR/AcrR family transcriptional regulator [Tabrizicola sp.]|uniref:TetR/AcrR family transcriptional regulator n=1 Tax=Tabrizicola sp. TaxID=2005166 RepID=UPI003F3ECCD0